MLLAFGALIAAGIPVLLAVSSVAATIGVLAPLSHLVHAESTVTSMIVLIGMAVGVDYSLFYLKREREERAAGRTTLDAVEIAAQTSGHSILVSGAAVIAALSGLFLMGDATFNSLAVGSILVVGVAVLGSITVLPALLMLLGRWVDRPRVPLLWRLNRRIGRGGVSSRLLGPVLQASRGRPGRLGGRDGAPRGAGPGPAHAQRQHRHAAGQHHRGADPARPAAGVPGGGCVGHGRRPERPGRRGVRQPGAAEPRGRRDRHR